MNICLVSHKINSNLQKKLVSLIIYTILFIFVFIFCAVIIPKSKSFPYSDDWMYVGIAGVGWREFFTWVLSSHNEHFIPILKIIQFSILELSRFDFRALIALNFFISVSIVLLFLEIVKLIRGRLYLGDAIIPLLLLNSGFNVFAWGFSFQFCFSVFLEVLSVSFYIRGILGYSKIYLYLSNLTLVILSLCGLNGVIVSIIFSFLQLIFSFCKMDTQGDNFIGKTSFITLLISLMICISTFSVADSSGNIHSLSYMIDWTYSLVKSLFCNIAMSAYGIVYFFIVLSLSVYAILLFANRFSRNLMVTDGGDHNLKNKPLVYLILFIGLISHLLLCVAIALGRSKSGYWPAGMELHYGFLATPLLIYSWLLLSGFASAVVVRIIGSILIFACAFSFLQGNIWRKGVVMNEQVKFEEIAVEVRASNDLRATSKKYIKEFYWIEDENAVQLVENGLVKYRRLLDGEKK